MKASKFFLSTFIAAAAMTSTAFAESYNVTTDGPYTTIQSAANAATSGDTINLNAGNTALSGSVSILKDLTLTGTAVIDWSVGHFFIGRGTNAADAALTISNANLSAKDAPSLSGFGFHISNEEKGESSKKNGTLNIVNNSNVVTDYMINKNVVNVDGSSLTVQNGLGVAGRIASETVSGEDHTAKLNITNKGVVTLVNENGIGIGNYLSDEGCGELNISGGSTFESKGDLTIHAKGAVNLSSGILIVANKLKNSGTITVSGTSTFDAAVSGDGLFQVTDGTLALNKGVETEIFVVGKSGYRTGKEAVAGESATVTVTGVNTISGNADTATWVGLANDTDWSADTKGTFVLTITGEGTKWDGGSTHIANAGQVNVADGAYAEFTYTKVRGGLKVDNATVDINSTMNVYGEDNYTNGDDETGEHIEGSVGKFEVVNGADVDVSDSLQIGKASDNPYRVGNVTVDNASLTIVGTTTVHTYSQLNVVNEGTLDGSSISNNGTLEVGEGSTLTATVVTGEGDVVLAGTMVVTGGSFEAGNVTLHSGAYLGSVVPPTESTVALASEVEFNAEVGTVTIVADEGLDLYAEGGLSLETLKISGDGAQALLGAIKDKEDALFVQAADGTVYSATFDGETGSVKVGTAVPEPSAFGLLAGLGALALVVARRRRK